MKGSLYTLVYSALLGAVCAVLLAGVGTVTGPYRRANAEAEKVRNILGVLEVPFDGEASSGELLEVFEKTVSEKTIGNLTVYVFADDGEERAIAVPFAGQGLWGPIRGFLSLKPDLRTIRGITFHEQEETPGLGGEIASERFREQFNGKVIESAGGVPGIRIRHRRKAVAANEVDGLSGATMTCKKVEAMLNETIEKIAKERGRDGQ